MLENSNKNGNGSGNFECTVIRPMSRAEIDPMITTRIHCRCCQSQTIYNLLHTTLPIYIAFPLHGNEWDRIMYIMK